MGFFKSIFSSTTLSPEEEKAKEENKNFEIFKYDGIRTQNMGQLDYAEKCFREALKIRDDEEVLAHLGQTLSIHGKLEEAFEVYNRLTNTYPNNLESFLALANVCFLIDKHNEMLTAAEKAIALNAESAAAYFLQGRALFSLHNDVMAVAALTKAIALQEEYVQALLLRAEVLMTMQQYADSEKDINAVLALNDADEDALRLKGKLFEATDRDEDAEKVYRNLIETDPFFEQAYTSLGGLLIRQNKLDEAIKLFDDAIEMSPNFADAYQERGRAKLLKGDKEGSVADAEKALELKPKEADISGQFKSEENKPINILGI